MRTVVAFGLVTILLCCAPVTGSTDPALSITAEELRGHLFFLASDELGGRTVGSSGFEHASRYAVSQLRAAGLKPALEDEAGNPTWYQTFIWTPSGRAAALFDEPQKTWNVVAMVEGTDPQLKNEYVTVGAHLDHVGPYRGQVYNGADDNASGSTGLLEIAEAVAMSPPKRSVIFILYGAEEVGLVGSRYFVDNPPVPLEQIVININLDMIGRSDRRNEASRAHYVVGSERTCRQLRTTVEQVNAATVNWPLDFEGGRMVFGASDHYSYHQKGIPVVFFFSGIHADLHRYTDDPEKIDFEKMEAISRLVFHLIAELGNDAQRPCEST